MEIGLDKNTWFLDSLLMGWKKPPRPADTPPSKGGEFYEVAFV
jgi:hypothetical protein